MNPGKIKCVLQAPVSDEHASLTSAQHLFVQRAEAGQLQQASRDVGPESHSADAGLSCALAQRSDVQTRHLMLHLCRAAGHRTHDHRRHVSDCLE